MLDTRRELLCEAYYILTKLSDEQAAKLFAQLTPENKEKVRRYADALRETQHE